MIAKLLTIFQNLIAHEILAGIARVKINSELKHGVKGYYQGCFEELESRRLWKKTFGLFGDGELDDILPLDALKLKINALSYL